MRGWVADPVTSNRSAEEFSVSLRHYARAIRKHWLAIVIATLIGVLAAIAVTAATKPVYEADATGLVHLNSTTSQQSSTYAQNLVQSFPSYVHSPDVLRKTIADLHLHLTTRQLNGRISASNPAGTFNLVVQAQGDSARQAQNITNEVAKNLASKIESLETAQGGATSNGTASSTGLVSVSFAVPAAEPTSASSPRPALYIALGLLAGLAVGICIAVVRDQLDTTIKTTEDLSRLSGASPLGTIRFDQEFRSRPLVATHSETAGIEDFRSIRTTLRFVDVDDPPRQIVISSSVAEEGKSVTACNLAITLAQADLRVCLVEGDLRRPRATSYLGLDGTLGLTDVVAGTHTLDDALVAWHHDEITVLPAGTRPPDPAQFLGSKAMSGLLAELRERFDLVIIDAPPLLPVSDAAVLGAMSDGVILVARSRRVRHDQFASALLVLRTVNARLLGTVLTHVPARQHVGSYGSYANSPTPPTVGPNRRERAGEAAAEAGPSEDSTSPSDTAHDVPSTPTTRQQRREQRAGVQRSANGTATKSTARRGPTQPSRRRG